MKIEINYLTLTLIISGLVTVLPVQACESDCATVEPECTEKYEIEKKWLVSSVRYDEYLCGDGADFMYLSWEVWCSVASCDESDGLTECANVIPGTTVEVIGGPGDDDTVTSCSGKYCSELCVWEPCDPVGAPELCTTLGLGKQITITTPAKPLALNTTLLNVEVGDQIFILYTNDQKQDSYGISEDLRNECGSCDSDYIKDKCGVCGGDGTSCEEECIEQEATIKEKISSRRVKRRARTLKNRVKYFNDRARKCGASVSSASGKKANRIYRKIVKILEEEITNTILVCDSSICTSESTRTTKRKITRLTGKLYKLAQDAKINAISICGSNPDPNDNRKRNADYTKDVLRAVKRLPGEKIQCE